MIVLALPTTVRPASLAAVYALLTSSSPRRVMIAYLAAGAAFTIGFGLLVIAVFHGVGLAPSDTHRLAVVKIVVGSIVLGLGLLLLTGRIGGIGGHAGEGPRAPKRWEALLNKSVTVRNAAVAGPVTHLPGIFYLVALNLIVNNHAWLHTGVLSLLLYNVVWFCLPIAALAICIVNPAAASDVVGTIEQWAREHSRAILLWVSFGLGAALIIDGIRSL